MYIYKGVVEQIVARAPNKYYTTVSKASLQSEYKPTQMNRTLCQNRNNHTEKRIVSNDFRVLHTFTDIYSKGKRIEKY